MEKQTFEIRDLRKKEKFVLDGAYLNGYAKLCKPYATAVYVSLCRHADKEQKCWPSIKKIAEEHDISTRQVIRAVKILESYKIIASEQLGKKLNNRYYLLDKSEWTDSHISEVTHSHITSDSQSHHLVTDSHIHSKETHIKETHSKDSVSSNFEKFYTAYPKKVARGAAEKAFKKCAASLLPEMLNAIEKHKKTEQWQKNNGEFIPYPATWLNQRRWEDEVKERPPMTLEEEARELVKQCEADYGLENGSEIAMQRFQIKHFPNDDQEMLKFLPIFKM